MVVLLKDDATEQQCAQVGDQELIKSWMKFLILYFYAMIILSKRYSNGIFCTEMYLGMTSKLRAMPLAKGK